MTQKGNPNTQNIELIGYPVPDFSHIYHRVDHTVKIESQPQIRKEGHTTGVDDDLMTNAIELRPIYTRIMRPKKKLKLMTGSKQLRDAFAELHKLGTKCGENFRSNT